MKAILACDKNGGMGFNNSMPWPTQPTDLARFKKLTTNTTILMGRKTWESTDMPKPLPNRNNLVVSSQELDVPDNVLHLKNLNNLPRYKVDWCIGGANLITSLLSEFEEIHISKLFKEYECDSFLNLDLLPTHFKLHKSTLCLTHYYEILRPRNASGS